MTASFVYSDNPYWRPTGLAQALDLLEQHPGLQVMAGGTDWYAARVGRPVQAPMLDIGALESLQEVKFLDDQVVIGAGASWTRLQAPDLAQPFVCLAQAARQVGGWQVQNRGSLGGNLCNASPAADSVPALLALDAQVELRSARGTRSLPVDKFLLGPRRTALQPGELLHSILIPRTSGLKSSFSKLGSREYLVISIVMLAIALQVDETRRLRAVRIAVGACSPVAQRLTWLEQQLEACNFNQANQCLDDALRHPEALQPLSPIDDVRATASYRLEAVKVMLRRGLQEVLA